jgi:hypothetical protein
MSIETEITNNERRKIKKQQIYRRSKVVWKENQLLAYIFVIVLCSSATCELTN